MKVRVSAYTFSHAAQTVTLTGYGSLDLRGVLLIVDMSTTTPTMLWNFAAGPTGSVATNVITLAYDTNVSGFADSDELYILYDDPALSGNTSLLALEAGGYLQYLSDTTGTDLDAKSVGDSNGSVQAKLRGINYLLNTTTATAANQSTANTALAAIESSLAGTLAVSGTVTANAGTNLNTSALALESGGNLAAAASVSGTSTDAAVVSDANGTLSAKLRGIVKILASAWVSASNYLQVGLTYVGGNAVKTGSGNGSSGSLNVYLGTDQPSLTNPLTVTEAGQTSTDAAVVSDANGSVPAYLRGLVKMFASVYVSASSVLQVAIQAMATGGYTPGKLIAANSTNATSVKASAGTLGYLYASNVGSGPAFLKIYNKASAPTVGTDTPVHTFLIPVNPTAANGAGFALPLPTQGMKLSTGIAFAITGAVADADTTVIAANQVVFNYGWI